MSAENFEAFLARLYVDPEARARFLADPHSETQTMGLTAEECEALRNIDRDGLEFAARSFARKRMPKGPQHDKGSCMKHWWQLFRARFRVRSVDPPKVGTTELL
jgi:hypothetical protein